MQKKVALNKPRKGQLYRELKQEGRVLPSLTSAGNMCIRWLTFFTALCTSMKATQSVDSGVTDQF